MYNDNRNGQLGMIEALPALRQLRHGTGLRRFLSDRGTGLHYGQFTSFEEARQWLPPSPEFCHDKFMDEYVEVRTQRVFSYDYPVIFWLQKAFDRGATSIFDIGGSVGVHFYSYARLMEYPASLKWLVFELEPSVLRGREFAAARSASQLAFTTTMDASSLQADVWIAAGALEFIEDSQLDTLLTKAAHRPRHILLNKMPLHDGEDYVSAQNIGNNAFVPHYVYNRSAFVGRIESLGYRLIDAWDVAEREFAMAGKPEQSFGHYSGLYFQAL